MWTLNDAQGQGWPNRAIEIYILLSWDSHFKSFWFSWAQKEGWRPDDPLGHLSTAAVRRERMEKSFGCWARGKDSARAQGIYQGERKGLRGWPHPFAWASVIDLLVVDASSMPLGGNQQSQKASGDSCRLCSSEDLACFTYKPHCSHCLDCHLEIAPHHWMSILICSFHQEASIKATPVECIIVSPPSSDMLVLQNYDEFNSHFF